MSHLSTSQYIPLGNNTVDKTVILNTVKPSIYETVLREHNMNTTGDQEGIKSTTTLVG